MHNAGMGDQATWGTMLYTGKRMVGPFDDDEVAFLRDSFRSAAVTVSQWTGPDPRLEQPIGVLGLSSRPWNALERGIGGWRDHPRKPIKTVGELVQLSVRDLAWTSNIGKKSVAEIVEKLRAYGFEMAP